MAARERPWRCARCQEATLLRNKRSETGAPCSALGGPGPTGPTVVCWPQTGPTGPGMCVTCAPSRQNPHERTMTRVVGRVRLPFSVPCRSCKPRGVLKQSGGHEGALAAAVRRLRSWHRLADTPRSSTLRTPRRGRRRRWRLTAWRSCACPERPPEAESGPEGGRATAAHRLQASRRASRRQPAPDSGQPPPRDAAARRRRVRRWVVAAHLLLTRRAPGAPSSTSGWLRRLRATRWARCGVATVAGAAGGDPERRWTGACSRRRLAHHESASRRAAPLVAAGAAHAPSAVTRSPAAAGRAAA